MFVGKFKKVQSALKRVKLFVFDLEEAVVPTKVHTRKIFEFLQKHHLFRPKGKIDERKISELSEFKKNFQKYSLTQRIKKLVYFAAGSFERKAIALARSAKIFIRPSIYSIVKIFPRKQKAILTASDFRLAYVVAQSIGASKIIANEIVSRNGKLINKISSRTLNVRGWNNRVIDSPKEKLAAFKAILKSTGISARECCYFCDDVYMDGPIVKFLKREGGISVGVKNSPISKMTDLVI